MSSTHECNETRPCPVPPHPDVVSQWRQQSALDGDDFHTKRPHFGMNDGTIFQPVEAPPDTRAASRQPNLRGPINVLVCLVEFQDRAFAAGTKDRFQDLFFSTGVISTGSVTEYYSDVSGAKISITGKVEGPFKLPNSIEYYANGGSGLKGKALEPPNIRTMADHTVDALVAEGFDITPYDNHGRAPGYIDALIIVHAGRGAEETGSSDDLWSCKWLLPAERQIGQTKVYPFLTIPEDAKLGVCAHEIGHLVFGWPDLYDISYKNDGIGKWCLMAGGSWGGGGLTPAHPSAWCKNDQEWVTTLDSQDDSTVYLNEVKADASNTINANRYGSVYKLNPNGSVSAKEYFLLENRNQSGFDTSLPGEGLLIWHVDENMADNDSAKGTHGKVTLMDASGQPQLVNQGDASNPFPGTLGNRSFAGTTAPNSHLFAGSDTAIAVNNISDAGRTMKMDISVNS